MLRVGIVGCGNIASVLASTMEKMQDEVRIEAVASRSQEKAQEFAGKYGVQKAYGSYEELYRDSDVDLVYVAVPHSHHHAVIMEALEYGKNILSEKAFTVNEAEAREVFRKAEEKGCFVGEAIWTRYMPSRFMIREAIDAGKIGRVTSISANLGYKISHKERIQDPRLAGGALLDIGIYPLNFALMAMGDDTITGMAGLCVKGETGVDMSENMTLTFHSGVTASISADAEAVTDRKGWIYGTEGSIEVINVNNPERINIYSADRSPVLRESIEITHEISGYEYEIRAAAAAISAGKKEPDEMPWSETLRVMRLMDTFRKVWGIKLGSEIE